MVLIVVALAVLIGFKPLMAQQTPQGSDAIPLPAGEKPTETGKDPGPSPAVVEEVHTELRLIPYQKIQKPDSTLQKGVVKIVQQGRQGRERVTYKVKKVDGRPVERTDIGKEVLSQPKPHIELIGTAARTTERVLMEIRPIPFQKEQKPDETLPKGTTKVLQQGREGEEKFTYRVIVTEGKEMERIILGDEILTPPVNQIEAVGTGPEEPSPKQ
jgi:uncharacterized protein YabE (DUF348 family)